MPGMPLFTLDVGSANETATGNVIGAPSGTVWDEYAYNAIFSPVSLSATTTYWFAMTEIFPEPFGGVWGQSRLLPQAAAEALVSASAAPLLTPARRRGGARGYTAPPRAAVPAASHRAPKPAGSPMTRQARLPYPAGEPLLPPG
jgi:hypothetical protein